MCDGEIVASGERVGVFGAECANAVSQDDLVHVDGLGNVPSLAVCVGEFASCAECVGVVGAQDPRAVGQESIKNVDGSLKVTYLSVRKGKVAARGQYVGFVRAEGICKHVDCVLEGEDGLRAPNIGQALHCFV